MRQPILQMITYPARQGKKTALLLGILTYISNIYKYLSNTFDENS